MKKPFSLILTLLLIISLTACGGSSEAAGEKAPAAAVEIKACNHDWAEASCKAPRTCLVCGETEGEITDHGYGKWQAEGEDTMLRACVLCGETESAPLDRELIAAELLTGNWDYLSSSSIYGSSNTYNISPYLQCQLLRISEPGRAEMWLYGIHLGMSWTLDRYEKTEEGDTYYLSFTLDDGSGGYEATFIHGKQDSLILSIEAAGQVCFCRNDELEPLIAGRYVSGDYCVELHRDRSVSGNIDGELRGYWAAKPLTMANSGYVFGLNVNAERGQSSLASMALSPDGEIDYTALAQQILQSDYAVFVAHDLIWIGSSPEDLENISQKDVRFSFDINGIVYEFVHESAGEISDHDQAINDSAVPGLSASGDEFGGVAGTP